MPSLAQVFARTFDPETIALAQGYVAEGRVRRLRWDEDTLTATVTGRKAYTVTVDLFAGHEAVFPFDIDHLVTACTCPIGGDCKHAAAALLTWAAKEGWPLSERENDVARPARAVLAPVPPPPAVADLDRVRTSAWQPRDRLPMQQWLHHLLQRSGDAGRAAEPGQALVYVLTQHPDWLSVLPVATRQLKSGRAGLLRRFRSAHEVLSARPGYASDEDLRLCAELTALDELGWSGTVRPLPQRVLEGLLATGRLRWDDHVGLPVNRLPPLELAPRWVERRGQVRIEVGLPEGTVLLPVAPTWYRTGPGIGPISAAGDVALIAGSVDMPWLHPAEAAVLAEASGGAAGPLPASIPAALVPLPVLRLIRLPLRWYDAAGRHARAEGELAVVSFRYGDDEVLPSLHARLVQRGDGTPLVRSPDAEQARLAELDRLGLAPFPGDGGWSPPPWLSLHRPYVQAAALANEAPRVSPAVIAALRGSGWEVDGGDAATVAVLDLGAFEARVDEAADGWFELHLGSEVGGAAIDLVPLLTPLLRGGRAAWERLPLAGGDPPAVLVADGDARVVRVPLALLTQLADQLVELFSQEPGPGGGWRIDPARADLVEAIDRLSPRWIGADRLRGLAERLRSCLEPPAVAPPAALLAELRPYQLQGLAWLQRLRELGVGGLLADDMGLGKTVQVIAHLLVEAAAGRADRPNLVVCPASVVGVWREQIARFAPSLTVTVLHGPKRTTPRAATTAVVITSYGTLARDVEGFAKVAWHIAICDEAQAVKNAGTSSAAAVRRIDARQRLALTGTPVENHLGELHALLGWAAPGVLGSVAQFTQAFRKPIEDDGDRARQGLLRRRVAPFLLRRTKTAVAADLPPRTDIDVAVEFGPAQRRLYDTIRLTMDGRVRAAIAERGLGRSGLDVIEALLRLRQTCCDPRLLPTAMAAGCADSAKLEALGDLLRTLLDEGRTVLVFSQFTALLDLVESEVLKPAGATWLRLDGQSRDRAGLVERFQRGEAPVFLLSLKAGGTGLTLTAADSVILLDPWWNPAVERQAADRAHRIGQERPVTIYRLVVSGTVEERIRGLQARKAALADALTDETGQSLGRLTLADIEALLGG